MNLNPKHQAEASKHAKEKASKKLKDIKKWAKDNKKLLTALGIASIFTAGSLAEIERRLRAKAKAKGVKLTMDGRYKSIKQLVRAMAQKAGLNNKKRIGAVGGVAAAAGLAGAAYYARKRYIKNEGKAAKPAYVPDAVPGGAPPS